MSQEPPSGFPPPPPPGPPGFPPPLPAGSAPAGGGTPWERRGEIGFVSALVDTTKEVLTGPTDFFRRMPVAGGVGSPLLYAVVIGYVGILVSAVYSAVFLLVGGAARGALRGLSDRPELSRFVEAFQGWGSIAGQVVFGPLLIVIGLFVWAGIVHLMLLLLDGAGQGFEATLRVMAYSHAANVFSIVPVCGGLIVFVYGLVLSMIGLSQAHRIPAWKGVAAVLLPLFLCCCCCGIAIGMMVGGLASIAGQAR